MLWLVNAHQRLGRPCGQDHFVFVEFQTADRIQFLLVQFIVLPNNLQSISFQSGQPNEFGVGSCGDQWNLFVHRQRRHPPLDLKGSQTSGHAQIPTPEFSIQTPRHQFGSTIVTHQGQFDNPTRMLDVLVLAGSPASTSICGKGSRGRSNVKQFQRTVRMARHDGIGAHAHAARDGDFQLVIPSSAQGRHAGIRVRGEGASTLFRFQIPTSNVFRISSSN